MTTEKPAAEEEKTPEAKSEEGKPAAEGEQQPKKRPYVAPELVHLGSVADLTLTVLTAVSNHGNAHAAVA